MQANNSNINDMFSGTGSYPLENLSKENRWVKLADALDWTHIEEEYNKRLSNQSRGACNKPARMVIGAMIIKHTLCCSDEGTIVGIQENPYMQYLVGLKYFQENPIFSPELFVTLRKRIDDKFFNDIMLSMHKDCIKKSGTSEFGHSDKSDSGTSGNSRPSESSPVTHKGKMKVDATCTDAEMRYPTDINSFASEFILFFVAKFVNIYESVIYKSAFLMEVIRKKQETFSNDRFGLKLMERRGSGMKKIIGEYKRFENLENYHAPEFNSNASEFHVTMWNLNYAMDVIKDNLHVVKAVIRNFVPPKFRKVKQPTKYTITQEL